MIKQAIAASLVTLLPVMAMAEGDADKGERVFRKCKACHQVGEGAQNKVGPILNGLVDRPIASIEGFGYSSALSDMGAAGKTWTVEDLSAFLTKPKDYAPGTKMAFAGLRKEADVANVIAYLNTFTGE